MLRPKCSPPGSSPHCSYHHAEIDDATFTVAPRGRPAVSLRPRDTVVVGLHAPVACYWVCGSTELHCARKRAADAVTLKDRGGR